MTQRPKYVSLVDGFAENNGSYYAKTGGSYATFKVPDDALHPPVETLTDPILLNLRFEFNKFEGEKVQTNNVAEALAMYQLLLALVDNNILIPNNYNIIYSDSTLILNQIKGLYKVNIPMLKMIYKKIQELFVTYREKYGEPIHNSLKLCHLSGDIMKRTIINH